LPFARAQATGPRFGLRPSLYGKTTLEKGHFQYAVKAGSKLQDAVEVLNFSKAPITLELYAADLVQTKGGSLAPAQRDDEMHEVGAWMKLERESVTVPPGGKKYVSFTVSVPKGKRPRDYLGAVVASTQPQASAGSAMAIQSRVALISRVRVPGKPHLEASISGVRVAPQGRNREFTIELENTGNLLFTAEGRIDVTNDGRRLSAVTLTPPNLYLIPGGRATFHATWAPPFYGNRTTVATFDLASPGEKSRQITSEATTMSFFSWTPIVVLGLLLVLTVIGLYRRTRRTGGPAAFSAADPSAGATFSQ
jgi:hypothetical protein